MKDPQDITSTDEYWTGVVYQARAIARDMGYGDNVTECAVKLYDWRNADTDLTPAEYVVHRYNLAEADRVFRARMDEAVTERQRDRVVEQWEAATALPERLVGA